MITHGDLWPIFCEELTKAGFSANQFDHWDWFKDICDEIFDAIDYGPAFAFAIAKSDLKEIKE